MKIVLSLSGGMDSATLLAQAVSRGYEVIPVGFYYGSKHGKYEQEAARQLVSYYKLAANHQTIDLTNVMSAFKSDLLLSGGEIPEGHYTDSSMSRTVVPGRNIIFASVLSGLAWSVKAEQVWLGVHAGDHAIYPDCRPGFINSMREAVHSGTDGLVLLKAPYLNIDKTAILKIGLGLKVPYDLTRTCYKDQKMACGKCGSCTERIEAFTKNNVTDPLEYEE